MRIRRCFVYAALVMPRHLCPVVHRAPLSPHLVRDRPRNDGVHWQCPAPAEQDHAEKQPHRVETLVGFLAWSRLNRTRRNLVSSKLMLSRTGSATVPSSPVAQILPQAPAVSESPSRLSLLVLGDDSVPLVRGACVTFSRHSPCHGNMGCEGYDPCGDSMETATLERIAGHNRCWDCHLETDAGQDGFLRQRFGSDQAAIFAW